MNNWPYIVVAVAVLVLLFTVGPCGKQIGIVAPGYCQSEPYSEPCGGNVPRGEEVR
jgi:hypothetical protein